MRKLVAIFIVSVYITSFTEVHQFFKLPVLWQHYVEHQQEDEDLSFLEYLSHHYETHDDHDDDHDRDMQLPFKDFGHCTFIQAVALPSFKIELKSFNLLFRKTYVSFYHVLITVSHLNAIWQPPKL